MSPCVYSLSSRRNGSLYIGMTTDIRRRVREHHASIVRYTSRYRIRRLVYLEFHDTIEDALIRERRMKEWLRSWKIALIEGANPDWDDLTRQFAAID
jgi:putative endonuclease